MLRSYSERMSKALPYNAVSQDASARSGLRVFSDFFWLSIPLLAGASFAAASWGQLHWWPGAALVAVYGMRLMAARPQAADSKGFQWDEVTRVEVVTHLAHRRTTGLGLVVSAGERQMYIPGEEAVSCQLLQALATNLGPLDQALLLRAMAHRGDGRFTVWQLADNRAPLHCQEHLAV